MSLWQLHPWSSVLCVWLVLVARLVGCALEVVVLYDDCRGCFYSEFRPVFR
jgi:hypothetical protein